MFSDIARISTIANCFNVIRTFVNSNVIILLTVINYLCYYNCLLLYVLTIENIYEPMTYIGATLLIGTLDDWGNTGGVTRAFEFASLYLIFSRSQHWFIWSSTYQIQQLIFGVFDLLEHAHFKI